MEIIGLRIEKYVGTVVSGHNCDFEYEDAVLEKHIICGVLTDKTKVEIELSRSEGECGSGWCTASWGHIRVNKVKSFGGYTFKPKTTLRIDDIAPGFGGDIENTVFNVSDCGGDDYYPSGDYSVSMKLFKETSRHKELRPVWIFRGRSNVGKSFLASRLTNLEVYETDSCKDLPKTITASVIVLGNKYPFQIEDITKLIIDKAEIQIVEFVDPA